MLPFEADVGREAAARWVWTTDGAAAPAAVRDADAHDTFGGTAQLEATAAAPHWCAEARTFRAGAPSTTSPDHRSTSPRADDSRDRRGRGRSDARDGSPVDRHAGAPAREDGAATGCRNARAGAPVGPTAGLCASGCTCSVDGDSPERTVSRATSSASRVRTATARVRARRSCIGSPAARARPCCSRVGTASAADCAAAGQGSQLRSDRRDARAVSNGAGRHPALPGSETDEPFPASPSESLSPVGPASHGAAHPAARGRSSLRTVDTACFRCVRYARRPARCARAPGGTASVRSAAARPLGALGARGDLRPDAWAAQRAATESSSALDRGPRCTSHRLTVASGRTSPAGRSLPGALRRAARLRHADRRRARASVVRRRRGAPPSSPGSRSTRYRRRTKNSAAVMPRHRPPRWARWRARRISSR